jgi:hypothetical protein
VICAQSAARVSGYRCAGSATLAARDSSFERAGSRHATVHHGALQQVLERRRPHRSFARRIFQYRDQAHALSRSRPAISTPSCVRCLASAARASAHRRCGEARLAGVPAPQARHGLREGAARRALLPEDSKPVRALDLVGRPQRQARVRQYRGPKRKIKDLGKLEAHDVDAALLAQLVYADELLAWINYEGASRTASSATPHRTHSISRRVFGHRSCGCDVVCPLPRRQRPGSSAYYLTSAPPEL